MEKSIFPLYLCYSFSIYGGARLSHDFCFSLGLSPPDLISSRLIFCFSRSSVFGLFGRRSLPPVLLAPRGSRVRFRLCSSPAHFRFAQPKARPDFRLLFFCAVSHWSAACSGLDFVAAAPILGLRLPVLVFATCQIDGFVLILAPSASSLCSRSRFVSVRSFPLRFLFASSSCRSRFCCSVFFFVFLFGALCFAAGENFVLGILVPICTHRFQCTQDFSAQDLLQPVIVPAYRFLTVLFYFACRAVVQLAIAFRFPATSMTIWPVHPNLHAANFL
jgi:hypothetical protein